MTESGHEGFVVKPETYKRARPDQIIYVSCDQGTLARIWGFCRAGDTGWTKVQPLDMFPWTGHVESIILMTNSGSKGK